LILFFRAQSFIFQETLLCIVIAISIISIDSIGIGSITYIIIACVIYV